MPTFPQSVQPSTVGDHLFSRLKRQVKALSFEKESVAF